MKRLIIVSGLILVALFFMTCVNAKMVNSQTAEATFVVR